MKLKFPKSKLFYANLVIVLLILGGLLLVESGPEPWLDSEKSFMARLHNSLWNLDNAKNQWAREKNKPEDATPSFDDLTPYLGKWKNTIDNLKSLGVKFKITSTETNQSDVATLTRGIRFRAAICPYYRAGTSLCLQTGWKNPPPSAAPIPLRIWLTCLRANIFLYPALFLLVIANGIIFLVRTLTKSQRLEKVRDTPSGEVSSNPSTLAGIRAKDLYILIFGCLFCLLGLAFLGVMLPGDGYLAENMDNGLGLFCTGASLVLPLLCLRFLKVKAVNRSQRMVNRCQFLVSLAPAACILWAFLSAWAAPFPCHVMESDTKRITQGMTKAQVLSALGEPRGSSSGDRKARLTYDLQIPWGSSGRQFFVDLIDDKVVAAKIVRYGGELGDDFWESDLIKELKAGNTLPNRLEVEQACLLVCQQEDPGIVEVTVLDLDLCLLNLGFAKASVTLVETRIAQGATNSVTKPLTMVLAKGVTGWQPTEYELMGVKRNFPEAGATNQVPSAQTETNRPAGPVGPGR